MPTAALSSHHYLPRAASSFLLALAVLCLLLTAHYKITLDQESNLIQQKERALTELTRQLMHTRLSEMAADVRILAGHVSDFPRDTHQSSQRLTEYFLRFASNKPDYAQLRFINIKGDELVRINNNQHPEAVTSQQLQNKAHRYYFEQGMLLLKDEIYISRFDLNVEQGLVEENNPTLRVIAPVFANDNTRMGIVIANLNGRELFEQVWGNTAIAVDAIALVSDHGYSLMRPQADKNRVLFSDTNTLAVNSPELWKKIDETAEGQITHNKHFFAFATLEIAKARGNNHWKIFTILDEKAIDKINRQFIYTNMPLFSLMVLMIGAASFFHARYQFRHEQVLEHNAYERSFRHLLEDIELAAVSLTPQGTISFCNDHFLNLTEYSREAVFGLNWTQIFIPQSLKEEHGQRLQRAFQDISAPKVFQSHILTSSGNELILSWTYTLQQNSHGQIEQISLIGEDITARLAAEKELRQLNQAVEQSANAVMITNTQGLITYVNPAFCHLTGYSPDEVKNRSPGFLKSGYTSDDQYLALWKTLQQGNVWRGEFHNCKKNGQLFWERAVISPVRDNTGKTLSYLAVKQDITEEKRLQVELESETQERIRNEQFAAVGRMANMVAHDLRNPLSSIKVGLQMSSRKPDLDNDSRELFQISLDQIRHMEGILEDLLTYARPDALRLEWLSIKTIIEQVVIAQLQLIKDRNVFINQDYDNTVPKIYADPVKLRQAIQNLIVNAIQAAEANQKQVAHVTLKTRMIFTDQGLKLKLEIRNNGMTVDPCLGDKVFEPFFTTKAKGTGLGLAIVQRIIQQHKGSVRLEAMHDEGTRALVLLPITAEPIKAHVEI